MYFQPVRSVLYKNIQRVVLFFQPFINALLRSPAPFPRTLLYKYNHLHYSTYSTYLLIFFDFFNFYSTIFQPLFYRNKNRKSRILTFYLFFYVLLYKKALKSKITLIRYIINNNTRVSEVRKRHSIPATFLLLLNTCLFFYF